MTYSIIPPILLVLSIIGIIIFLIKKAPQVALLEEKLTGKRDEKTGIFESRVSELEKKRRVDFKQRYLAILEKITRNFRRFFLQLGQKFSSWNENIRNKRGKKSAQTEHLENYSEEQLLYRLNKSRNPRINSINERKENYLSSDEEREVKPIVSEKVVSPRSRGEIKDRLEKILIDRIAVNPKDIEAYERLGEYYLEIRNLDYAKECFKQVIKLDPTNQSAKSRMRRLERLLGR